ncbi:MAG TPA: hypothetical protein VJH75_02835 [Patescibacteria group bacterium]|nr:hypothetical protein [Patescibacteria group bacterium]
MVEIITVHNLDNPNVTLPYDRDDFYNEQVETYKKTGAPTKSIEVVNLLLFNTDKQIILQKRSRNKNHNPSLLDKSVGGHIKFEDSPHYTLMVETVQELMVPSIVLYDDQDFDKSYGLLRDYLQNVAIVKKITTDDMVVTKIFRSENIKIANKIHLFFGIFNGATRPADKEASGILFYNLDDLNLEIKEKPEIFTNDLITLLSKYKKEIDEFVKKI